MITEKESKDLDRILKFSLNSEKSTLSIERLKNELFVNEDEAYIRKLFFILRDNKNTLLYPKNGGVTPDCFFANSNAESFLNNGGFEKSFTEQEKQKAKDDRKDRLEVADLNLKEWMVKYKLLPYVFSSLSLLGTTISIIISIKALNYKKDQPQIQLKQESIQPLQSNVKSLDSLSRVGTRQKIDTLKH